MAQGLEDNIGLQVVQNLVISKVGELGQVKDWLLLLVLIIFIVEDFDKTLSNKVHLLNITLVTDNSFTWSVNSAVHVDDQLIGESSLALLKEVVEGSLEFLEDSGVLDKISLHLWCDLLVELELLDNQIEIVQEGLFNIFSDVVVQSWLNVEWLVGLLDLFDPHIQGVEFLFDEIIEVIGGVEDTID